MVDDPMQFHLIVLFECIHCCDAIVSLDLRSCYMSTYIRRQCVKKKSEPSDLTDRHPCLGYIRDLEHAGLMRIAIQSSHVQSKKNAIIKETPTSSSVHRGVDTCHLVMLHHWVDVSHDSSVS
jgi:hypothetical protein